MTRKDYVLVADTIKMLPKDMHHGVASLFASRLAEADASFNQAKFLERVLGKEKISR